MKLGTENIVATTASKVLEDTLNLAKVEATKHKTGEYVDPGSFLVQDEWAVNFKFAAGKGSTPGRIPVAQYDDFLRILEGACKQTPPAKETCVIDVVRNTVRCEVGEDGVTYVSFKTGRGKGQKTQSFPLDQAEEILGKLKAHSTESLLKVLGDKANKPAPVANIETDTE